MIRAIVAASMRFRWIVLAAAIILMVAGLTQLYRMPVDVFPEFAPPIIEIQTPSSGLFPEEVEALVTVPLEQAMAGLPRLHVMRSKSVAQLSSIMLEFERGTDLTQARQLVQERVALVSPSLPTWAAPPVMLPPLSASRRVMMIGLSSKTRSLNDLSMTAYWKIDERLLRVPGVANIAIWGERLKMLQVQVDPERLRANNVTLNDVMETTADALEVGLLKYSTGAHIGTGGWVDTPNQRLGVRHVLPIIAPADLARVRLKDGVGDHRTLGDVADVKEDHQPLIGEAIVNGHPGLLLVVEKFPWGNTLEITRGIDAAIESMKPGLPDVEIDTHIFRPATFIQTAIDNLSWALLTGCILVIVVLFAFLYEWRVALISLVAIPLSLVTAVLVLYLQGSTMNTMVLAGLVIALGAVVDDAIIDVENIVRRIREQRLAGSTRSTASMILEASLEVRSPIIYATLIIVIAVVPVFFMSGLAGAFFQPLAVSYAIALLASMLVALTVMPAMSLMLLDRVPLERRRSPLADWLRCRYEATLTRIVDRPGPAYVTVGVITLAGIIAWPHLGQELLPEFKERDFLMHWVATPGTTIEEMTRVTTRVANELLEVPGVGHTGAHIGQALIMEEVVGANFGENWISVDPSADFDETFERVEAVAHKYPGLYRNVQTYLSERVEEVLAGAPEAIVVRIYGQDLDVLKAKAEEIKDALADIEGIEDLHVDLQEKIPQIEVETDLAAAKHYGIKPGDVRRAAATIIAGTEVGDVFKDGRAYDVQVWGTPNVRHNAASVSDLLIDTPDGGHVRLSDVAKVSMKPSPNIITRENFRRRIDVGANASGRDLASVVADVKERLAKIQFPLEYNAELLGEYTERQAAERQVLVYSIAAGVGILLLLQVVFASWRLAILAFITLPSALVGGVLATWLSNGNVSIGSLVGFLAVFGIAARNVILLIHHSQHLEKHEGETFGIKMTVRGAKERLAPILMTAATAGLGLVPLVIIGDVPGQEIVLPTAIVILGGLVTSTLLTLFVVPSLYLRFGRPEYASS
jgi:CzcA family heavy metal efflux pump